MDSKKKLDCRGMRCPRPIIEIAKAFKSDIEVDQMIEVVADDPVFLADVRAWCKKTQNELVEFEINEVETRLVLKKVA